LFKTKALNQNDNTIEFIPYIKLF